MGVLPRRDRRPDKRLDPGLYPILGSLYLGLGLWEGL